MDARHRIAEALRSAFPAQRFDGLVAAHQCPECFNLCRELQGKSWHEISNRFLEENDGCLPLLTPDAYRAFLPAWLNHGLSDPEAGPGVMALINMSATPRPDLFNPQQRQALVDAAHLIHVTDPFSRQDKDSMDRFRTIALAWRPSPSIRD